MNISTPVGDVVHHLKDLRDSKYACGLSRGAMWGPLNTYRSGSPDAELVTCTECINVMAAEVETRLVPKHELDSYGDLIGLKRMEFEDDAGFRERLKMAVRGMK